MPVISVHVNPDGFHVPEPLASELSQILGWVEQLAEVDTDGVPPMTSVAATRLPMRDDVAA